MKNKKVKSKLFKLETHSIKGEYFLTIFRNKDYPNQDVFWFTAKELRELQKALAAMLEGRKSIGIEKDEQYAKIAINRIAEARGLGV